MLIHVAVINRGNESNLRSSEGIVTREVSIEDEDTVFIGGFLRPEKQDFPNVDVRTGVDGNEGVGIFVVGFDLLHDSLQA